VEAKPATEAPKESVVTISEEKPEQLEVTEIQAEKTVDAKTSDSLSFSWNLCFWFYFLS
jgi:hypothetical protein